MVFEVPWQAVVKSWWKPEEGTNLGNLWWRRPSPAIGRHHTRGCESRLNWFARSRLSDWLNERHLMGQIFAILS